MPFSPDIKTEIRKSFVSTTDATATPIANIVVPANSVFTIKTFVSGSRSGGASGTAGDSAGYEIFGTFKNVSGIISQVGSTTKTANEDQVAWDCDFSISGAVVTVFVKGASGNSVDWSSLTTIYKVQ